MPPRNQEPPLKSPVLATGSSSSSGGSSSSDSEASATAQRLTTAAATLLLADGDAGDRVDAVADQLALSSSRASPAVLRRALPGSNSNTSGGAPAAAASILASLASTAAAATAASVSSDSTQPPPPPASLQLPATQAPQYPTPCLLLKPMQKGMKSDLMMRYNLFLY